MKKDNLSVLFVIAMFLTLFFGPFLCMWLMNTLLLSRIPGAILLVYRFGTPEWLAMLVVVGGSVLTVLSDKR